MNRPSIYFNLSCWWCLGCQVAHCMPTALLLVTSDTLPVATAHGRHKIIYVDLHSLSDFMNSLRFVIVMLIYNILII